MWERPVQAAVGSDARCGEGAGCQHTQHLGQMHVGRYPCAAIRGWAGHEHFPVYYYYY